MTRSVFFLYLLSMDCCTSSLMIWNRKENFYTTQIEVILEKYNKSCKPQQVASNEDYKDSKIQ